VEEHLPSLCSPVQGDDKRRGDGRPELRGAPRDEVRGAPSAWRAASEALK
jgi:hypothetical protein